MRMIAGLPSGFQAAQLKPCLNLDLGLWSRNKVQARPGRRGFPCFCTKAAWRRRLGDPGEHQGKAPPKTGSTRDAGATLGREHVLNGSGTSSSTRLTDERSELGGKVRTGMSGPRLDRTSSPVSRNHQD